MTQIERHEQISASVHRRFENHVVLRVGNHMGPSRASTLEISRVSTKGQITLPKKVREAIGVRPGDAVTYDVAPGVVTLRRLEPIDLAFHAAVERTLEEWSSKEDDEAYGDL